MTVIGLACEDRGHFRVVTTLVDAVLTQRVPWIDGVLDVSRSWRGLDPGERWYSYDPADAMDLRPFDAGGGRISPAGHIAGEPLKPEAGMWRKVLMLFCHADPRPEIVVLARDLDGYPARRDGMEQVRAGILWPFEVVLATAQPEVEAWVACGFVPETPEEHASLAQLTQTLSFDPTTASERLTSHPNDAPTDAKRVLGALADGDPELESRCLADRDLLHRRGTSNGLARFLAEVEDRIVPCFGAPPLS